MYNPIDNLIDKMLDNPFDKTIHNIEVNNNKITINHGKVFNYLGMDLDGES